MKHIYLITFLLLQVLCYSDSITITDWVKDPVNEDQITTRLQLPTGEDFALFHSGIYSASKIWIDGKLHKTYGKITTDSTSPLVIQDYIPFTTKEQETEITIELKNQHYPWNRVADWIRVDKLERIESEYNRGQITTFMIIGALSICSVLFLLLSFVNLKIRYNIYMGIFTLFSLLTMILKNSSFLTYFKLTSIWEFVEQISRVSLTLSFTFILIFLMSLFPEAYSKRSIRTIVISSIVISLTSFIPLYNWYYYKLNLFFNLHIVIAGLFIFYKIAFRVKKSRSLAKTFLVSLIFYWIATLFDNLWAYKFYILYPVHNFFIIPLVVSMFLLIAKERLNSSKQVEESEQLNKKIRDNFSKFVPLEILDNLGNVELKNKNPGEYVLKASTLIEIDIRNFTGMSEDMTPKDTFALINNFYTIVGREVERNGGFIESYGGDGVKAIFSHTPDNAIEAAKSISHLVKEELKIDIGMAIHFGKIIMGTVGYTSKIQATTISSVTRILHKMDLFESKMMIEILITAIAYNLSSLKEDEVLKLGSIILKDENEAIELYEVRTSKNPWNSMFKVAFQNAVDMLEKKQYTHARSYFELALLHNPEHKLSQYYIKELDLFRNSTNILFELKIR